MDQRMLGQTLRKTKEALRSIVDGSIVAEAAQRAIKHALCGCPAERLLGRARPETQLDDLSHFSDQSSSVDQNDVPSFIPNPRARPRGSFNQLRSRRSYQGAKEITDEAAAVAMETPCYPRLSMAPMSR